MSESTATAQTIVAIVAASVVVVGAIVLLSVIMLHRDRKVQRELEKLSEEIKRLKADAEDSKSGHGKQFQSLEDLMKPYKKHLLQSAFDLQSRLYQQVGFPLASYSLALTYMYMQKCVSYAFVFYI